MRHYALSAGKLKSQVMKVSPGRGNNLHVEESQCRTRVNIILKLNLMKNMQMLVTTDLVLKTWQKKIRKLVWQPDRSKVKEAEFERRLIYLAALKRETLDTELPMSEVRLQSEYVLCCNTSGLSLTHSQWCWQFSSSPTSFCQLWSHQHRLVKERESWTLIDRE